MGLDPAILQKESIARLLSPEVRRREGIQTATEAQHKWQRGEEKKMHEAFRRWLNLHRDRLYFDTARMDQRTTNRKGHPDFVIQGRENKVLNLEFKAPGGVLSSDQKQVHAWLTQVGCKPHVCFDVATAIEITRREFGV